RLLMPQKHQAQINFDLDHPRRVLAQQISLHVHDLVEVGWDPSSPPESIGTFPLALKTGWPPDVEARLASKAFRAVMADFVGFLDKAVAFLSFAQNPPS